MKNIWLNVASCYGQNSSLIKLTQYCDFARQQQWSWLSLIDVVSMQGHFKFYQKCLTQKIQPILGIKFFVQDHSLPKEKILVAVIARNYTGLKQLFTLSFFLLERNPLLTIDLEQLFNFNYAHCILVAVPQPMDEKLFQQVWKLLKQKKIHYYIGIDQNTIDLYRKWAVPKTLLVWFPSVWYFRAQDLTTFCVLLAINQGVSFKDIDPKPFIDAHFEADHPAIAIELQENISVIVKQVNIKWPQTNFDKLIPHYQKSRNTNDFTLLTDLVTQRLQQIKFKNKTITQKYHKRLRRELLVIQTCRLASYFLIVYDYVHYAKTHDIMVGPGRGSAAGSLVSYLLDITTVDPIRFNLIFERFLNVGRVQLPDIDIDVQDDQRIKVIKYLQKKYGINHVCYINTFQRLKIKIALRDISRVFNIPLNEVNQIAKAIGRQTYSEFMVSTAEKNSIAHFYYTKYQQIFQHMHLLINLPRHAGTHAAGVILCRRPLIKHLPMMSGNDGVQKTQLDMHDLGTLGFLKMDILGLTNLTILSKLKQKLGKTYQLPTSTFRDEKTFALLRSGAVSGIFQLESPGMRDLLTKIKPGSLEDIAVTMALFRPGPLEWKEIYLSKRAERYVYRYPNLPALEKILGGTYGVLIFQEQVILLSQHLAGFSLPKADILRHAMAKKKLAMMRSLKIDFIRGCLQNKIATPEAERFWKLIAKFSFYGFNRAHAIAYAMIAYWMAFLKAHHYLVFMAVLLDSVIGDDSRTHFYLQKIMQQGMTILPPTINQPFLCYQVHDHQIRLPIITVRHIGPVFAENIWLNFQKKGRFSSIYDFCDRLSGRAFNQKSYFALVYSGTFDEFGLSRTVLADNFSVITNYASLKQKVHDQDDDVLPQPVLTTNKVVDENELLRQENYYLKIILRVKLIQQYRQKIVPQSLSIKSLLATLPSTTELVVMIIKMTTLQDKRNRNMAFLDVIDEQYYAWERLVVFASVFPKVINELAVGNIVHMVIVRSKNQQKTSYFLAKAQWLNR